MKTENKITHVLNFILEQLMHDRHYMNALLMPMIKCLLTAWCVIESIPHPAPFSYFSVQPVLNDWCNKGCGMCYPVCRMVHIKDPLLLIGTNSPCIANSRFPLVSCVECVIKETFH